MLLKPRSPLGKVTTPRGRLRDDPPPKFVDVGIKSGTLGHPFWAEEAFMENFHGWNHPCLFPERAESLYLQGTNSWPWRKMREGTP